MEQESSGQAAGIPEPPVMGPTTAFEEQARTDARRFRVVAIVAGALFAPTVLAHILFSVIALPQYAEMFRSMGGQVPFVTGLMFSFGPLLGLLLVAIDLLVFWAFYRLARKYWIGLLFAPLFVLGAMSSLLVWLTLYLPITNVITLVK